MIGMLSLIALSLFTYWIDQNPVERLSIDGLAEIQTVIIGAAIARPIAEIALLSFAVLLVFLLARREAKA